MADDDETRYLAAVLLAGPEPAPNPGFLGAWINWRDIIEEYLMYVYRNEWWYKPDVYAFAAPEEYSAASLIFEQKKKEQWDAFNEWRRV